MAHAPQVHALLRMALPRGFADQDLSALTEVVRD
jgi:hypothetical protein